MRPIKRSKMSDMVLEQLVEAISAGDIQPGSKLPPERELLKTLDVSRNTLREALQRADAMGLLSIRHGEGTFVNTADEASGYNPLRVLFALDPGVLEEVVEARLILERETARLAAQNATTKNLERMDALMKKMQAVLDRPKSFRSLDTEFHREIAEATQNRVLPRFLESIGDLLRQQQEKLTQLPGIIEKSFWYHEKIAAAIVAKDPQEAQRWMEEHLSNILLRFQPLIEENDESRRATLDREPL